MALRVPTPLAKRLLVIELTVVDRVHAEKVLKWNILLQQSQGLFSEGYERNPGMLFTVNEPEWFLRIIFMGVQLVS